MKHSLVIGMAVVLGGSTQAHADVPIDLATELRAIAAKFPAPPQRRISPVAAPGCAAPTPAERADLKKRVLAWIDSQHPDERDATRSGPDDYGAGLELTVGCKEPSGAVVLDVSQDREKRKRKQNELGTRRNYVLRASAAALDVIAEDTSTMSMYWMEWADEGRISLLGQLDLDGDGALDVVYSDHEHEGGSSRSFDHLHVRFATGKLGESGQVTDLADVKLVANTLVVAGDTRDGAELYACLDRDLLLGPCAAARPLQAAADRRAIVDAFTQADRSALPDRELLAQQLTALGITGKRKAALVAAAPETTPGDRAQRKVTAFLVKANLVEPAPMPELFTQRHPAASAYLDELATKLGDAPCTTLALTDDDKRKTTAWVRTQDEKAAEILMGPATCGAFTWVSWWPTQNGDNKRREVLLSRDATTRILGFTFVPDMPGGDMLAHLESWFTHGTTVIGIAIGGSNLWVIADGKIVAQTKGDTLAFYRADDRFSESSTDIFLDGGTLWHATPTGRERVDPTLTRDHEARRAAIALVSQSPATGEAKYLAALQLLGADKALIAECKKLP